ncbi:MAG TPA: hypothetical protein VGR73_06570 [Bryobacteraceae bacterium]|nr:hypothetical protein [Bryobacteraceae bacterium]
MPTQPFAGILGVIAILLILWGHFRALGQINKNLNDLKDILRSKDSK